MALETHRLHPAFGVEVLGVIVNKAYPHEYERIDKWMRRVLEMMGVRLLGVIPYESDLARATMLNLFERFRGKVINAEPGMGAPLGKIVLGAMSAGAALDQLTGQVTLICPVDREDLLVAALSAMYISGRKDFTLSSIVICGKEKLSETLTKMIKRTTIPVLQVDQDIYTVMADVHASNFKILPSDTEKIRMAIEVVQNHVNLDATLEGLQEA